MSFFKNILFNLPEVSGPSQKKLSFKEKLKWTLIVLILYYVLSHIPLYGLGKNSLEQFEQLSVILGAKFGGLLSLGIGPIVTASIVLQLLNGSGILKFDLTSHDGKKYFQGLQKFMSIIFIIFEGAIYIFMGGLSPPAQFVGTPFFLQLQLLLVFQLFLGGILILFMDEVVSKWGFGSGISLFIAAGVSESLLLRALNPLKSSLNPTVSIGAIPALFQQLLANQPQAAALELAGIISTIIIFVLAVYVQAMKVEIPLSFGRVRGHGIRWPLSFVYTSNIPVILVAALLANVQLWARLLQNWGHPILGTFSSGGAATGFVAWIFPPNIVGLMIKGSFSYMHIVHALVYIAFFIAGCILFSWFWVQTSGMDARSQARQMMSSGLQIPGFRRDERVLERLLNRYIPALTVMGAVAVGLLAALADLSGALTSGTGLLLTVMIVYRLYEDIARQHMMDMNPMLRKFMGG